MQERTPMRQVDERTKTPRHTHPLRSFSGVKRHKSVWRAMRKGLVAGSGDVLPTRPFNNAKRTRGRKIQKDFEKALVTLNSYLDRAQKIDRENAEKPQR